MSSQLRGASCSSHRASTLNDRPPAVNLRTTDDDEIFITGQQTRTVPAAYRQPITTAVSSPAIPNLASNINKTRSTGTVHASAKARLTGVAIWIRITDSPPKFNRLFIGPLTAFAENFMKIHSEVFAQSCQQIDKQANKQRRLHILLGGGKH